MNRALGAGETLVPTVVKTAALLFALLLGGCVTTTTALEPQNRALSPDKARIYFIRVDAHGYKLTGAPLKVDDIDVGELANHSYLFVDRPPGRHTISVRMPIEPTVAYTFEAAAGRSYYFVLNVKTMRPYFVGSVMTATFEITNPVGELVGDRPPFAVVYWGQVNQSTGASIIAEINSRQVGANPSSSLLVPH